MTLYARLGSLPPGCIPKGTKLFRASDEEGYFVDVDELHQCAERCQSSDPDERKFCEWALRRNLFRDCTTDDVRERLNKLREALQKKKEKGQLFTFAFTEAFFDVTFTWCEPPVATVDPPVPSSASAQRGDKRHHREDPLEGPPRKKRKKSKGKNGVHERHYDRVTMNDYAEFRRALHDRIDQLTESECQFLATGCLYDLDDLVQAQREDLFVAQKHTFAHLCAKFVAAHKEGLSEMFIHNLRRLLDARTPADDEGAPSGDELTVAAEAPQPTAADAAADAEVAAINGDLSV